MVVKRTFSSEVVLCSTLFRWFIKDIIVAQNAESNLGELLSTPFIKQGLGRVLPCLFLSDPLVFGSDHLEPHWLDTQQLLSPVSGQISTLITIAHLLPALNICW